MNALPGMAAVHNEIAFIQPLFVNTLDIIGKNKLKMKYKSCRRWKQIIKAITSSVNSVN